MVIRGLDDQPKKRDSTVILHIGAKNTGKTQATLSTIGDFWKQQKKPTLVLDVANQRAYNDFLLINLVDVANWELIWHEAELPFFKVQTQEIDVFFYLVNQYVRNTFVVFEDSTAYMTSNLSEQKKGLILYSRNNNNDYYFNLHSFVETPPFLFRHCEVLIIRRTLDDMDKFPTKIPQRRRIMKLIEQVEIENRLLHANTVYKVAYRTIELST